MAEKIYLVDLNLSKNELLNARFHNVPSLPTIVQPTTTPVAANNDLDYLGLVVYHETTGITYTLNSVDGVVTWVPLGSGAGSVGGGIFVMGVTSNVIGGNAVVTNSTDNEDITEVTVTDKSLKFNLLAVNGSKNLKPALNYTLGTNPTVYSISPSEVRKQVDRPIYLVNNYPINVTGYSYITFMHEDGATKKVNIIMESLPVIAEAIFVTNDGSTTAYPKETNYPEQTELKDGDTVKLRVTMAPDGTNSIIGINVYNQGGFSGTPSYYGFTNGLLTQTITLTVAHGTDTVQNLGAVISIVKTGGATSAQFNTKDDVTIPVNGINYMKINDLTPALGTLVKTYPTGFSAIKNDTTVTVSWPISNASTLGIDGIDYTTIYSTYANQLDIPNPNTYSSNKIIGTSWSGYNTSISNYTLSIRRVANGTTATASINIAIASISPIITMTLPSARLISDIGTGYSHVITATSDQQLNSLTLIVPTGGGTWLSNSSFTGSNNNQTWKNNLLVTDALTKGQYTWGSLVATNIAGVVQATINTSGGTGNNYTLGGFTTRTATMAGSARTISFPNIAVTSAGYDAGKCIISWKGTDISAVLQPSGPRFAAGTSLTPSQPINNAWCIDAISNTQRTTEVRFLNSGEAISSTSVVTIREIA